MISGLTVTNGASYTTSTTLSSQQVAALQLGTFQYDQLKTLESNLTQARNEVSGLRMELQKANEIMQSATATTEQLQWAREVQELAPIRITGLERDVNKMAAAIPVPSKYWPQFW